MIFGTWNVQGISTKIDEVFRELQKFDIDIAVLTETKKKGQGNEMKGDYIHIYSGVEKSKRAKRGVSIAIHKRLKKFITNWSYISEQIVIVNMKLFAHEVVIIGAYAPSDSATDDIKEEFLNELTMVLENLSNRKEVVLMGDFNGRTGKALTNSIIGSNGEDTVNNNGELLIELCNHFSLRVMNGYFPHKMIHKYTWTQTTRNLKSIIDYVILKQNTKLKTMDVRVLRGAECGSDHFLLRAKIYFKFINRTPMAPVQSKELYDAESKQIRLQLENLQHPSTDFLFKIRLAHKITSIRDPNAAKMYEALKKCLLEAGFEALGKAHPKNNDQFSYWWQEECKNGILKKKQLYGEWLAKKDQDSWQKYVQSRRAVKKEVAYLKNVAWDAKCDEVDKYIGGAKSSHAWKIIKSLRQNNTEKVLTNPIDLNKWKKYYEELLNEDRIEFQEVDTEVSGNSIVEDISADEIKQTASLMKNGKSSGPGGIPIELIKHAPKSVLEMLANIFNKILTGDDIPEEWKVAHISSIFKKGRKTECANYRGISVLSSLGRLYGKIIQRRIEAEFTDMEEQCGFRAGRSCVDNIFCLQQICEKRYDRGRETHLAFVDLRRAYDTIPWKSLFEVLDNSHINPIYVATIKRLYVGSTARVKVGTKLSVPFRISKGLRQGCCISPTLFRIYLKAVLESWIRKCSTMGIQIGNDHLFTLLFADDQVLIAQDEEDISYMLRKLMEEYRKWGLEVNITKTEYMVIGGKGTPISTDYGDIQSCEEFKYLGVTFSAEGTSDRDIAIKVGQGRQVIRSLNALLWNKSLRKETKLRILSTIVEPVSTYGSELWILNKKNASKVNALEMDFLRRSCGISRLQHVRNEHVRSRMGATESMLDRVHKRQLSWYGHMRRMGDERWPKKVWEYNPPERRKRGRPRKSWNAEVEIALRDRNLEPEDWQDRARWKVGIERRQ